MDGDLLKFRVTTFQTPIMTMYCALCHSLWAVDYEEPTCFCEDYFFVDPYNSMAVINLDLHIMSMYYDGDLSKSRFWITQLMPYYAFLMEVAPSWIDFP